MNVPIGVPPPLAQVLPLEACGGRYWKQRSHVKTLFCSTSVDNPQSTPLPPMEIDLPPPLWCFFTVAASSPLFLVEKSDQHSLCGRHESEAAARAKLLPQALPRVAQGLEQRMSKRHRHLGTSAGRLANQRRRRGGGQRRTCSRPWYTLRSMRCIR